MSAKGNYETSITERRAAFGEGPKSWDGDFQDRPPRHCWDHIPRPELCLPWTLPPRRSPALAPPPWTQPVCDRCLQPLGISEAWKTRLLKVGCSIPGIPRTGTASRHPASRRLRLDLAREPPATKPLASSRHLAGATKRIGDERAGDRREYHAEHDDEHQASSRPWQAAVHLGARHDLPGRLARRGHRNWPVPETTRTFRIPLSTWLAAACPVAWMHCRHVG